jgi:DMSO reductase anchor subunit
MAGRRIIMAVQWPLVIFTLFTCLGTGTFAVAGLLAGLGKAREVQVLAVIVALMTVVIGGIASFMHLQHWDRSFNGFGNLTSGITQELIALAVFVAVAVGYLVQARKELPAWAGWLALVISVITVIVMSRSYNMAARPIWDSALLWLYYLANAVTFGGLVMAALTGAAAGTARPPDVGISQKEGNVAAEDASLAAKMASSSNALLSGVDVTVRVALAGAVITIVAVAAYAIFVPSAASSFTSVGSYFDPTQPTKETADPQGALSGFLSGDQAGLFWGGALALGAIVPLALALVSAKKTGATLVGMAVLGAVCALVGGVCFRLVLYDLGYSVFVFY